MSRAGFARRKRTEAARGAHGLPAGLHHRHRIIGQAVHRRVGDRPRRTRATPSITGPRVAPGLSIAQARVAQRHRKTLIRAPLSPEGNHSWRARSCSLYLDRPAMVYADSAATRRGTTGEMSATDHHATTPVSSLVDSIEQVSLTVLKEPAYSVGAQIGNLNHARQSAVDEQWRLNNVRDEGISLSLIHI